MPFSATEASFIGLLVESMLYGMLTILTAASYNVLLSRRFHGLPVNKPIIVVSGTMFALATIHLAVDIRRIIIGVFELGVSDIYFRSYSDPLVLFKNSVYVIQTVLGDAFMVYRVYVVWSGRKSVIIPMTILVVAATTSGIGILVSFSRATRPSSGFYTVDIGRWSLAFFTLTMVTNVISTGLIASRIYWSERQISRLSILRTGSLSPVLVILIESGAIYSCSTAGLLATYVTESYSLIIIQAAMTSLIGLVYSLIIVRIGLGKTPIATKHQYGSQSKPLNGSRRLGNSHPIAVEMNRTRIIQSDYDRAIDGSKLEVGSSCASKIDVKGCTDEEHVYLDRIGVETATGDSNASYPGN